MAAIAVWLVLTLFAGLIAGIIADSMHDVPSDATDRAGAGQRPTELRIRRISPDQLYKEATGVLLNPSRQSTGILITEQNSRPADEPAARRQPAAGVVATRRPRRATTVVFAGAYTVFMRQEAPSATSTRGRTSAWR